MSTSTSPTRHPAPDPRLRELREALGQVTSRDFGRLSGRWRALSRKPDAAKIDALGKDIAISVARRAARAASTVMTGLEAARAARRATDVAMSLASASILPASGVRESARQRPDRRP